MLQFCGVYLLICVIVVDIPDTVQIRAVTLDTPYKVCVLNMELSLLVYRHIEIAGYRREGKLEIATRDSISNDVGASSVSHTFITTFAGLTGALVINRRRLYIMDSTVLCDRRTTCLHGDYRVG